MAPLQKKIAFTGIMIFFGWLVLRFIYFGSIFRNCIYTEQTIQMNSRVATGKFLFVGAAAIVTEPYEPYKCLPEFASIQKQIMSSKYEIIRDDGSLIDLKKITYVDSKSEIELSPVRLVAVAKHGIMTIDSGGGPFNHLILKDQYGVLYHIPTVFLGINKGEEFLELHKADGTKELLSANSVLNDR